MQGRTVVPNYERDGLRRELEARQIPFRLIRGGSYEKLNQDGWLRCLRQAIGMPVDELAERLGVCRWEIHRLEDSERNNRIMLETLDRAAHGLGWELVYALVPLEGSLKELAIEQEKVREERLRRKHLQRELERKPWLEELGWEDTFHRALRTYLRRAGIRVRRRKTERGVDEQLAEFQHKLKLTEMGDKFAAVMREAGKQTAG